MDPVELFTPEFKRDPFPTYRILRDHHPVYRDPGSGDEPWPTLSLGIASPVGAVPVALRPKHVATIPCGRAFQAGGEEHTALPRVCGCLASVVRCRPRKLQADARALSGLRQAFR